MRFMRIAAPLHTKDINDPFYAPYVTQLLYISL